MSYQRPSDMSDNPALLVTYIAREAAFKGIGPKRAKALGDAFGPGLQDALLAMDDGVISIIGEEPAINAAAAMDVRKDDAGFLAWLDQIGVNIPAWKAIRIARAWGPQGIAAVQANPYLLLAVSDWRTVDAVAEALGVDSNDPRRDVAAIEAVLQGEQCLGAGSTRMHRADAMSAAGKLLARPLARGAISAAIASGAGVALGDDIQPPGTAHMEAECALKLSRLGPLTPSLGVSCDDQVNALVAAYEATQPFPLTEAQREAIRMAHRHRLFVLGGYAGSGKTTVLRGVCETLEAIGRTTLIITLSGRAAKRAAEATGRRAITVARFLVEQEKSDLPLGPETALIADEASMLGLVEMWRILRRLGSASLILCGDPAQLAPVNPGIVFHHLVGDHDIRKVILDRVHRQDERTGIPALAEGVRHGQIASLPGFSAAMPGVTFTSCDRASIAAETLRIGQVLRSAGVDRNDVQIIAPTNAEIRAINHFFHAARVKAGATLWPGLQHVAEGEPVIWTENDHERGLTNGSLGRIQAILPDCVVATIDGQEHNLSHEDGAKLQLAYAISVHKAQGSQWPKVIVPLFRSRVVDRSLIYTALTRAQDQVIFMGDQKALDGAVARPPSAERRFCGFADWMKLARRFLE